MVFEFYIYGYYVGNYWRRLGLCPEVIDLSSEVTGWPLTLILSASRCVSLRATHLFFDALVPLGTKWRGGVTTPLPPFSRGVCRKPFGLARAKPLENRNAHKYISSTLNLTLPNSDKQLCCQILKCCTSKQLMLYVPFFPRIVQVCTLVWFTENRCVPVSMSHCHLPPSTLPFWRHKCPTNRA